MLGLIAHMSKNPSPAASAIRDIGQCCKSAALRCIEAA
jgi:hypothetical protein